MNSQVLAVIIACLIILVYLKLFYNKNRVANTIHTSVDLTRIRGIAISAGGTYGYTLPGALDALESRGLDLSANGNITYFVGTSAGAMMCALLACRIPTPVIHDFTFALDSTKLLNGNNLSDEYISCLGHGYLPSSEFLSNALRNFVDEYTGIQNITLQEVYEKYGTTYIAAASHLEIFAEPLYISRFNYPNMPIALAAQISSTIPAMLEPVVIDGKVLIDGAVVDPYPFKELQKYVPIDECIGILLDYFTLQASGTCVVRGPLLRVNIQALDHPWAELSPVERAHTVRVICDHCETIDMFNTSNEDKEIAYMAGVNSALSM
jgi:NTE family protein